MLERIQNCNVLVVGAGGIGCELLKNLALTGFRNIEAIDLDTIDVSNLNRQLLFRTRHVGMPKCIVAMDVAQKLVPQDPNTVLRYTPHHGNVCDATQFNVPFVKRFDVVLNALDNITARRRVNRLCLAANVPLVEAGTTGYLGQVNVITEGAACYECKTQEQQKVYPICTIRSTPSMPVHTIVWAKEFYRLLFGEKVDESMLFEDPAGEEPSTYMDAVSRFRTVFADRRDQRHDSHVSAVDEGKEHAATLLTLLYDTEIRKQLGMDRYKTAKKTPVPLAPEIIQTGMDGNYTAPTQRSNYNPMDILNPADCVAEFVACLKDALNNPDEVIPAFDKDDPLSMRFVTACSNLRSSVFSIEPLQSHYSAKGIAGNIIPAIATTNAICAGLQVLQAFHILRASLLDGDQKKAIREHCSYINCLRNPTRNGLYLTASGLEDPNPDCFVCRNASVPLTLNTFNFTLQDFLTRIVKKDLGFEEPTLSLNDGDCIWEEGDDADESFRANLCKFLPDLPCGGIRDGTILAIEDFSQDLTVNVTILHQENWDETDEEQDAFKFVIGGSKPSPKLESESIKMAASADTERDVGGEDDIVEVIQEANGDRKRPAIPNDDTPPSKKVRTEPPPGIVDVIEID